MSLKKFGIRFRPGLDLKWSEWKHETLQRSNILKLPKQIWEQIVSQKVRSTFLPSPSGCECGIYHCDSRDTGWEVGTLCHLRQLTASQMTSVFAKLAHGLQKVLILYPEDNTGHLRWQRAATQTDVKRLFWQAGCGWIFKSSDRLTSRPATFSPLQWRNWNNTESSIFTTAAIALLQSKVFQNFSGHGLLSQF